jgi:hypothetical protein
MTFVVNITSNGVFVKRKERDIHKIISFWVSIEHRAWSYAVGGWRSAMLEVGGTIQRAAGRNQRSEIRRQRSGVKLISDLRLLLAP